MNEIERINMAKAEINAAVNNAGAKYKLPPYIMELIINAVLSDVRGQVNIIDTIERERRKTKEEKIEKPEEDETEDDKGTL